MCGLFKLCEEKIVRGNYSLISQEYRAKVQMSSNITISFIRDIFTLVLFSLYQHILLVNGHKRFS